MASWSLFPLRREYAYSGLPIGFQPLGQQIAGLGRLGPARARRDTPLGRAKSCLRLRFAVSHPVGICLLQKSLKRPFSIQISRSLLCPPENRFHNCMIGPLG